MRTFTAVVEKCPDTRLYVGYVPGFPGARIPRPRAWTNCRGTSAEVIAMLLEDGEPVLG